MLKRGLRREEAEAERSENLAYLAKWETEGYNIPVKTAEQADALKIMGKAGAAVRTEDTDTLPKNVGPSNRSSILTTVLRSAPVGLRGSLKSIRLGGQSSSGRSIMSDSEGKGDGNHHQQLTSLPNPRGSTGANASDYDNGDSHQGGNSGDGGNNDTSQGCSGHRSIGGDSPHAPPLATHSTAMNQMAKPPSSETMLLKARSGRKISVVVPTLRTSNSGGLMSPQPPSDSDPWSLGALALLGNGDTLLDALSPSPPQQQQQQQQQQATSPSQLAHQASYRRAMSRLHQASNVAANTPVTHTPALQPYPTTFTRGSLTCDPPDSPSTTSGQLPTCPPPAPQLQPPIVRSSSPSVLMRRQHSSSSQLDRISLPPLAAHKLLLQQQQQQQPPAIRCSSSGCVPDTSSTSIASGGDRSVRAVSSCLFNDLTDNGMTPPAAAAAGEPTPYLVRASSSGIGVPDGGGLASPRSAAAASASASASVESPFSRNSSSGLGLMPGRGSQAGADAPSTHAASLAARAPRLSLGGNSALPTVAANPRVSLGGNSPLPAAAAATVARDALSRSSSLARARGMSMNGAVNVVAAHIAAARDSSGGGGGGGLSPMAGRRSQCGLPGSPARRNSSQLPTSSLDLSYSGGWPTPPAVDSVSGGGGDGDGMPSPYWRQSRAATMGGAMQSGLAGGSMLLYPEDSSLGSAARQLAEMQAETEAAAARVRENLHKSESTRLVAAMVVNDTPIVVNGPWRLVGKQ